MAEIGYIQVTRDCNQKCIICSNPPNNQGLDFRRAKKEVDELAVQKYKQVILTGGEPTLYDKLPELISHCLKRKIFPRIITNGQRIADFKYLTDLKKAGLCHLHLSIYSSRPAVQAALSKNKNSLENIKRALRNLEEIGGVTVDINTTISKYNAGHLSETTFWLVKNYPFIKHFVFNNLDPFMNRVSENPEVVPRLSDFELELRKSLDILQERKKTFRVERVPLCYLAGFEHISTETRKIVKREKRIIYFLDKREKFFQKKWGYKKAACCQYCFLKNICAGLYHRGGYYDEKELYPVFVSKEETIRKIFNN